jgi:hypothetical protein
MGHQKTARTSIRANKKAGYFFHVPSDICIQTSNGIRENIHQTGHEKDSVPFY